jgi:hypothetical protein
MMTTWSTSGLSDDAALAVAFIFSLPSKSSSGAGLKSIAELRDDS